VVDGKDSVTGLMGDSEVKRFVRSAYDHGKAIAASGEGADILKATGIASAPGVVIGKTGSDLAASFIEAMRQHRHWNRPK
jgi:catalase